MVLGQVFFCPSCLYFSDVTLDKGNIYSSLKQFKFFLHILNFDPSFELHEQGIPVRGTNCFMEN